MKFRQGLNLNRENFSEVPDFYWAEPELERMFDLFFNFLQRSLKLVLVRLFQVIKQCIGSKNAYSFS